MNTDEAARRAYWTEQMFLSAHIRLFECLDKELERTYYFRWWMFRKHLKPTPDGWVITE